VRETMHGVLQDIQSGRFADQWIAENEAGRRHFESMRKAARTHQIEEVGEQLRGMMPFLNAKKIPTGA